MSKIIVRRHDKYRLYVENPQTVNATYHLSAVSDKGVQRLRIPAPVAAVLSEVDTSSFREYAFRELLRGKHHNDPWYSEIKFLPHKRETDENK